MRGKLSQLVLLLLVFCLLTGSVGMAATQRFCAMLTTSPTPAKDLGCCMEEEVPACPEGLAMVAKKSCCSFSTTHQKLEVPSCLHSYKVQFIAVVPVTVSSFLKPAGTAPALSASWPLYSDSSPPLTGRQLLQRLQTLTI